MKMTQPDQKEILCNLCGESCALESSDPNDRIEFGGLLNQLVMGGYFSTPGNGSGALDDFVSYHFSLCEFCLDWLFGQFKIVPTTDDPTDTNYKEPWRPATQRVKEDDWRNQKDKFYAEANRRSIKRTEK
jgi:hypothetical protein